VRSAPRHSARVRFSAESVWDSTNPWKQARECVLAPGEDFDADVVFLSGTDWRRVIPEHERPRYSKPVVNLIQHVRHGCENDPLGRHMLLRHSAIRVCVSPEVERAILATGRVRGPVFTIPDSIDVAGVVRLAGSGRRDIDVLVVANKQPALGRSLERRLQAPAGNVHLVDTRIPRGTLVGLMGRARVTVTVPNPKEGFYLPALEGMAAGTMVVCPDCVGNRSYCLDGENSFRPAYEEDAIVAAAERALAGDVPVEDLLRAAHETAQAHDLDVERRAFLEILDRVDKLWAAAD
jgi:glycosyltransferase involved in cell wall biosynthesis